MATDITGIRPDVIKVVIKSDRPVPAEVAGNLLIGFDRAFASYCRAHGLPSFRLVALEAGEGSWWVILQAAFGAYEVATKYPDLVPLFIRDFDYVVKVLSEQGPEETPKYLRELARSVARVGKRAHADAVDIISVVRISLHADAFDALDVSEAEYARWHQKSKAKPESENAKPISLPRALKDAGRLAEDGKLFGTTFYVHGEWYGRAEGMQGVLLPLTLSTEAASMVEDARSFQMEGRLERSAQGWPVRIFITRMRPIG